jgi:hypothetical protein
VEQLAVEEIVRQEKRKRKFAKGAAEKGRKESS